MRVRNSFLSILFLACFGAGMSQGAINACATSATGTVLNTISGVGNGCGSIDLSFENIAISGASVASGSGFVAPSLLNTALYVTGSAPSGGSIGAISLKFDPTTGSNWDSTVANDALAATYTYAAIAHSSGTYSSAPVISYNPPPSGTIWAFSRLAPTISGTIESGSGPTAQASVTTTFCLGAASTSGCSAADTGSIVATITAGSSIAFACGSGTTSTSNYSCTTGVITIANGVQVTTIGLSSVVNFNAPKADTKLFAITNFGATFDQITLTPEPSTVTMLGGSLLALGLLAKRRKRVR